MIDIHCHILPGVDDGPANEQQSLEMAQRAAADGIHAILATPHHDNGYYSNPASLVIPQVRRLNEQFSANLIPVTVYAGQEIRVTPGLLEELDKEELIGLNESRYLLLELPFSHVPKGLSDLIHELRVMDWFPIIAHPERNHELIKRPKLLRQLVNLGALSQLTAPSVLGAASKKLQQLCLDWCRQELVHFIASDAHDSMYRPFRLRQAYTWISKNLGEEYTRYYQQNAASVLGHQLLEVRQPLEKKCKFTSWRRN